MGTTGNMSIAARVPAFRAMQCHHDASYCSICKPMSETRFDDLNTARFDTRPPLLGAAQVQFRRRMACGLFVSSRDRVGSERIGGSTGYQCPMLGRSANDPSQPAAPAS
ncbi:hypothetical protein ACCO45_011593 [Purpureocillium lilacinum]|uniref:Uncharacterized protein n=1 Tax=Purpureocillium lilacinum TaxID=33203 RepID=A0ACC4DBW2_PURLI